MAKKKRSTAQPGTGVDSYGGPLIDPTANVIALVKAEAKFAKAIREADKNHSKAEHRHLKEIGKIRAEHAETLRVSDLDRLDKTRQVDVLAATASAATLATAVQTLANTSDRNAETLRTLVNATAQTMAKQCVSADTPVLCADLIWRPAGELQVGDELIGFDEEPLSMPHKTVSRGRKYRRSTVTANALRDDDLLRINTSQGSVRCNPIHPWLARPPSNGWTRGWTWIEAKDLQPGYEVLCTFDVWEVDRSWEGGWLAGIMDGEGCLVIRHDKGGISARIDITQVVGETADRIGAVLTEKIGDFNTNFRNARPAGGKDGEGFQIGFRQAKVQYGISNRAGVIKALGKIRPGRLLEKADQVWEGCYIGGENRHRTVISVENAGQGVIASLGTSTNTYIAGGFAMHNTTDQAQVLSAQTDSLVKGINAQIAELQKAQYQGAGKSSVADPLMAEMAAKMDRVIAAIAQGAGQKEGGTSTREMIAWVIAAIVGLLLIYNQVKH